MASHSLRPALASDLPALEAVIAATGLFPAEMLPDMIAPFLEGNAAGERWLVAGEASAQGVAYAVPERMTEGCWNLLLLAVHPAAQRQGIGGALVSGLQQELAEEGARLLLVETSDLPSFADVQAFYRAQGFRQEAAIRDFYRAGEGKIILTRRLHAERPRA